MKNYWYISQLYDLCCELQDNPSIEAYEAINHMEMIIAKLREEDESILNISFLSDYLNEYYTETYYTRHIWKEIRRIAMLDKGSVYIKDDAATQKFSKQDLIELMHMFFKEATDKKMYEIFSTILKSTSQIRTYKNSSFNSDCIYLPYHKKLLIRICPEANLDDVISIAHEIGHGIEEYINPEWTKYSNIYEEVISSFFEILCYHYFGQQKEFANDAIILANNRINHITSNAYFLSKDFPIIQSLHPSVKDESLNKNIKLFIRNNLRFAFTMKRDDNLSNYNYVVGHIIAIELFYIYLKDPNKAFDIITKISEISPTIDECSYHIELLKLGIRPNLNSADYQMELKRKLKQQTML